MKCFITVCLCIVISALSILPTYSQMKSDTVIMKKMVQESCHCFDKLEEVIIPFEHLGTSQAGRPDAQTIKTTEDAFNCLLTKMKVRKIDLGLEATPDSVFFITLSSNNPPLPALMTLFSPVMLMYGMRDCPYIFKFFVNAAVKTQEAIKNAQEKEKAEQDSLSKIVHPIAEISVREARPEINESYKKIKVKLKSIENKNYTFLVVERTEVAGKPEEQRFVCLERPEEGEEFIKDFKKYKGKMVTLQAYKQVLYNAKTKLYEPYWRVYAITPAE